MKSIKAWDKVKVITWSYKWTVSNVEKVQWDKVFVTWVNVRKKAIKKQWFMDKTLPIHISNVMIYSDSADSAVRVWFRYNDNWKKVRFCKKTWKEI